MSDNVGKISLDLELQSDLNKQIGESAEKVGEELKASLQNIGKIDFSKITSSISDTLKATTDNALSGINTSVENVFNTAGDTVSEIINITKENAFVAISEIKKAAEEMIESLAAMTKKIKFPRIFSNPKDTPTPNAIPTGAPLMPRGPPIGVKIPKIDLSSNDEYIKSQIDNLSNSLDITNAKIEAQQAKLAGLRESYSNTFSQDRKNKIEEQILKTEAAINKLISQSDKAGFELADLDKQFEELSNSTKNATSGVKAFFNGIKNAEGSAETFKSKLKGASNSTKNISKDTGILGRAAIGAGNSFNHMGNTISRSFSRVLKQVFVIRVMYKALSGLISYTNSALMTNAQFVNSLNQIRTNLQVAFMPIYQAVLPALNALMSALANATAYIATFINTLFGKTYKQSFNAVKGLNATKAAMGAYGNSAKKAGADTKKLAKEAKEAQKVLSGFDEINTLDFNKDSSKMPSADGLGGGADIPPMVMPNIDVSPASTAGKAIEELATKTKAVLATIFQPLKNAWAKDGAGVIAEFKRAIEGTKDTLKNFYRVLASPPIQLFIENIARIGLKIVKLGLRIYNDFILPILNWFIDLLPGAADGFNPILEAVGNFVDYLAGDGFPIVQAFLSLFLAFKAVSFVAQLGMATAAIMANTTASIANTVAKGKDIIETGILIGLYTKDAIAKGISTTAQIAMNVATAAWNVICGIATAATAAFGAVIAFLTSPIGIAVVAIGGLIAIGVALYKNWDTVKAKAHEMGQSISSHWDGMKSKTSSTFASMASTVGTKMGAMKDKIANSGIGQAWDKLWNLKLPKIKMPHFKIDGKFSLAPPSVPKLGVDWFAKGGVFDGPQVIGVGEQGKEAVMPLENNTGWIDNLAGKLNDKSQGSDEVVKLLKMIVDILKDLGMDINVDGDKLARISIKQINKIQRQAGKTLLEV